MRRIIVSLLVIAAVAGAQPQYKKAHRNALARIVDGNAASVAQAMRTRMAEDPSDAEDWFILAIALTRTGELDDANEAVRRCRALGFPDGRLAAASVDWLRPLAQRAPLARLRETLKHRALMGPMVGHVSSDSVRVWLRTLGESDVRIQVMPSSGGPARTAAARSNENADFTCVVRALELESGTRYDGTVTIDGRRDPDADFSFTTAPATPSSTSFTLAFGGGAGFTPVYERMWKTIGRMQPDFMLLLGDNVYIDHPTRPDVQRFCYHRRQSSASYRHLLRHTPTWSIWDDHDFGTNDCHGGARIDSRPWKRAVWDVFRSNWANPGYGGDGDAIGCWYRFTYGPVDFFMLDGRMWRTNPKKPGGSMLGPVQKRWLEKELVRSTATFKVICSPVPFAKRTKPGSKDTWDGFPDERRELFDFITSRSIEGVLLMSADRHRSDAWKTDRDGAYPLYEFNSSRLTNIHLHKTMKRALFSYNRTPSFGLVHFDLGSDDPTATYEVVTIDGIKVHRLSVARSSLR